MRKTLITGFAVTGALVSVSVTHTQQSLAHKYDPFDYPVTISRCQPSTVDHKYDPNPAVRVDISFDQGFYCRAPYGERRDICSR